MNAKGKKFSWVFAIFWSGMTLLFDNEMVVAAVKQHWAKYFAVTEGRIISSDVTIVSGEEGDSERLNVEYSYRVEGREYRASRYSYDKFSPFPGCCGASNFAGSHPAGTSLPVFYNPRNPGEAVLTTGLTGQHLFEFTFMTPFNALMLGLWFYGLGRLKRRWFKPVAGGVKIILKPRRTVLRLTEASVLTVAFLTVGLLAFGAIFLTFIVSGDHPTLLVMVRIWLGIVTLTTVVSLIYQYKILRGKYDLTIDELNSILELPRTHGRKTRVRLPLNQVRELRIEKIVVPDGEGGPPSYRFAPTLDLIGGQSESQKLVQWWDEEKADDFVEWLRAKLARPVANRPLAGKF